VPLWGNVANSSQSVKYGTELARTGPLGSGNAAKVANNTSLYQNTTPDSYGANMAIGQFGVTTVGIANSSSPEYRYPQHAGWNMRYQGTGPVKGGTAQGGSGFANGETFIVSGATVNAIGQITANATGNAASFTVLNGGAGFSNADTGSVTFNREQHLATITVSGTPTGYNNTDVINVSGNSTVASIVNASATVSTNSTGGFVSANVTIANSGLFQNTAAVGSLTFSVANSTGGASGGSGATFAGTFGNSTGGTITLTLGGRANRVQYETIVAFSSLTGNTSVPG
jgi:hypothetical protein